MRSCLELLKFTHTKSISNILQLPHFISPTSLISGRGLDLAEGGTVGLKLVGGMGGGGGGGGGGPAWGVREAVLSVVGVLVAAGCI